MNGEMDELDEQEKERRKNDQIEYRNKQKTSNVFLFFGTLFEIAISFIFVFAIIILAVLICARVLNLSDSVMSVVYQIILILGFLGGLVLGFFVYRKLGRWVIRKWKLEDKLREDVKKQFMTRKEFKEAYDNGRIR